ncbi:YqhG family protein, partial [Bacillus pumilus]|uniref:YqhG family protein n=1 Tax=Bacillus pumilus TaxID=1408 RepID=UPI001C92E302
HHPRFTRLYQPLTPLIPNHIPLQPSLRLNLKISYLPHQNNNNLFSLPLHLIPPQLLQQFQQKLQTPHLSSQIPNYCFTLSTIIKPETGVKPLYS